MITKDERAILRLAGILWIYQESIKNEQKAKIRKKVKPVLKR